MSRDSREYKALLHCSSSLTDLLKNNTVSVSTKLLEKGLVTEDVRDWVLSAQGVSNQDKAARVVACVTDRVKDSAEILQDFIDVLKGDSYFKDIVETLCAELHSKFPHIYATSCSYICIAQSQETLLTQKRPIAL